MINKYTVLGIAFVPVEVEMVVVAQSEAEAAAKALRLECESLFGNTSGRPPRLGDFVVTDSADELAAHDFTVNQVIPILEK